MAFKKLCAGIVSRNPDSAIIFAMKGMNLARKLNEKILESNCCGELGNAFASKAEYDSSFKYYSESLRLAKISNNKKLIAGGLHNVAKCWQYLGDYDKALDYYYRALKINEEINNRAWQAYNLIGIGGVYNFQGGKDEKAIEFYLQALKLSEQLNNEQSVAYCLNNIGMMYNRNKDFVNAITILERALKFNRKLGNTYGAASNLGNLGISWFNLKNYNKALKNYNEALIIFEQIQEKEGIAIYLNAIGNVHSKLKHFETAISFSEKSLAIAREIKIPNQIEKTLQSLIEFNKLDQNFVKAFNYQEQLLVLRDTISLENDNKVIAEMETKYQTEKKEKENLILRRFQEVKLTASREKEKKQKLISYTIAVGLLVTLLFSFFVYNRLKITRKQKRIIELQKHVVDEKQKEIVDSIKYAKRLQEAILPPELFVKKHLPDSFIFYQPKDIVAGDFYWLESLSLSFGEGGSRSESGEVVLIAAADSTGHGVPGAMVSVVCCNALNRVVLEFGITDPGKILDKTRDLVLETFSRSDSDVKDGMDISLASINTVTREVKWSGANNPIWYLSNGIMKDIPSNKQPIGKTENPKPFVTHTIQLNKGDLLYLFTDGYADQFGGEKGKKFKYKSLKDLLISVADLPMIEQKEILSDTILKWKGSLEQVDDICVIGVRL